MYGKKVKLRAFFILLIFFTLILTAFLVIKSLEENVVYFKSPTEIKNLSELKHQKKAKNTDGKKTRSVRGIPKLMDANYAGGPKSDQCTLILCEGDSAKAGIVSGLSKEDRNNIGVFPLKGKPGAYSSQSEAPGRSSSIEL